MISYINDSKTKWLTTQNVCINSKKVWINVPAFLILIMIIITAQYCAFKSQGHLSVKSNTWIVSIVRLLHMLHTHTHTHTHTTHTTHTHTHTVT